MDNIGTEAEREILNREEEELDGAAVDRIGPPLLPHHPHLRTSSPLNVSTSSDNSDWQTHRKRLSSNLPPTQKSRLAIQRAATLGNRRFNSKTKTTSLCQASHEDFGEITTGWMRVNGALTSFRNLLSSANSEKRGSGGPSENPSLALINLESGTAVKYTENKNKHSLSIKDKSLSLTSEGNGDCNYMAGGNKQRTIVNSRLVRRRELFDKRRLASDYALFFALLGIVLMIIENELSAEFYDKGSPYSSVLKTMIVISTIILLGLIICYYVFEVQLFMNDNSAEDWRIAMTSKRLMQISTELSICAVCPIPGNFTFKWTTVHSDGILVTTTDVPVDVLLSIPMFLRLYLVCRVMLLHSRLFTDASSRSIGALNRVNFNTRFVLKTLMTLCPGTVLLVFIASLWVIAGWILRLCERHHAGDPPDAQAAKHKNYLNSLWLIAITFLSVGYGDITPNTYCGRAVAVITGIVGVGTSSLVVAVIARKLELTRAEKHVHNFMMDTQLTKRLKHAAANVLRETWLIYKHRRLTEKIEPSKIRMHQRKFLLAIYELRKVKRDQRKLTENSATVADIVKTSSMTFELVSDVHAYQEGLDVRLDSIESQIHNLQQGVTDLNDFLKKMIEGEGGIRRRLVKSNKVDVQSSTDLPIIDR